MHDYNSTDIAHLSRSMDIVIGQLADIRRQNYYLGHAISRLCEVSDIDTYYDEREYFSDRKRDSSQMRKRSASLSRTHSPQPLPQQPQPSTSFAPSVPMTGPVFYAAQPGASYMMETGPFPR
jgi:hypothetical protein